MGKKKEEERKESRKYRENPKNSRMSARGERKKTEREVDIER